MSGRTSRRPVSLTLRTATLFALVAALVVSGTGGYLFSAMRQEMTLRSDLQVTGRVEYFRHLLGQRFPLARLTANNGLFENMLGNEQDVLIFQIPGQKPLINVNPARVALPSIAPTPPEQAQTLAAVRGGETAQGVPLRAASAMVRLEDGSLLQISAAHVMANEQKMLARYLWRIVAAVAVAFLLIALLGYGVMRRGLKPLWRMAAQASQIAPNTLSTRLSEQGAPKELQQLTRSFNAMLDRLNEGYQRLTQFSADLAHEIRTPVGALMGQCQVALYQPRSVEEYETLLSNNMDELERISRMVENILFLARAGEAQSALNYSRLDVALELRRVADYFEGLAEERGIALSCEGEGAHGEQVDPMSDSNRPAMHRRRRVGLHGFPPVTSAAQCRLCRRKCGWRCVRPYRRRRRTARCARPVSAGSDRPDPASRSARLPARRRFSAGCRR